MNNHEQLQICFLIFVGNRLYSERELASRLPEVDKAIADKSVIDVQTPNGSLSIQFLGEDLWPAELWTEVNTIPVSTTTLLAGHEVNRGIDGQYASIRLKPMGEYLLYHLKSTLPSAEHEITRMLPFEEFIREWELMEIRMSKFISYLRKEKSRGINWYFEQSTPELRRIAGDERMQRLVEQDLVEMLSSSPCSQGYYCQEDRTFVKVPFGAPNPLYAS